jgi:hypothetical protein
VSEGDEVVGQGDSRDGEQGDPSLDLDASTRRDVRSVASDGFSAACLADPTQANCCIAGQVVLTGTSGDDFWSFSSTASTARCVLGNGGHDDAYLSAGSDTVIFGSGDDYVTAREGPNRLLGGAGEDILKSGGGADTLYGGEGSDDLYAGGGADWIDGGGGDDHIQGQDGNDVILPGEGEDYVLAGNGDDRVVVRAPCELQAGEYLSGGSGTDTLVLPFSLAEAQAAGLVTAGFEHVVIEQHACEAACVAPPACSGNGSCVTSGEPGGVACGCDDGWTGPTCADDVSQIPPEDLGQPDPVAWSSDPVSGLRYRRATTLELQRNDWRTGTWLVEASEVRDLASSGAVDLDVPLPEIEGRVGSLGLSLVASEQAPTHFSFGPSGATTFDPVFHGYLTRRDQRDQHFVQLVAGAGDFLVRGRAYRHISIEEGVQPELRTLAIGSPDAQTQLQPLPGDSGLTPTDLLTVVFSPAGLPEPLPPASPPPLECLQWLATQQPCAPNPEGECELPACTIPADPNPNAPSADCTDGIDNDGDGLTDVGQDPTCQHSPECDPVTNDVPLHTHKWEQGHQYMMMGDASFCMRSKTDTPYADLYSRVNVMRAAFNIETGEHAPYAARVDSVSKAAMRWAGSSCYFLGVPPGADEYTVVQGCVEQGVCPGAPAQYPYAGLGNPSGTIAYQAAAEQQLDDCTQTGELRTAVELVALVTETQLAPDMCGVDAANSPYGNVIEYHPCPMEGATLYYETIPHEIGHVFGCIHDCLTVFPCYGAICPLPGFSSAMYDVTCSEGSMGWPASGRRSVPVFGEYCLATMTGSIFQSLNQGRF